MNIYRVQKNGIGPFMSNATEHSKYPSNLEYFDTYLPDGSERNQQPDDDHGTALQSFIFARNRLLDDYKFGVASKQDLFTWFSPVYLGYLYAIGFSIWIYNVPEHLVVKGSRQVCFRVADANWSKEVNIKELRKKF